MSEVSLSTVRIAASPDQAKLFVAMLQGEGIPAYAEGESLADEVAISRRLMNLSGTEVKVPTAELERARSILEAVDIDEADLAAQAMAAGRAEERPVAAGAPFPRWPYTLMWLALGGLAGWSLKSIVEAQQLGAQQPNPFYAMSYESWGFRETWRQSPGYYRDFFDEDRDGSYERVEEHAPGGVVAVYFDRDRDGRYEETSVRDGKGSEVIWRELDLAGFINDATVRDKNGKEIQRLRWQSGQGFEVTPR